MACTWNWTVTGMASNGMYLELDCNWNGLEWHVPGTGMASNGLEQPAMPNRRRFRLELELELYLEL